ncbi:ATPase, T2SS/T4P/T4SS family [Tannockella kyphosi]|uniref:ATPase, T2SS/T4P/T4SS family n=1 Tax=Tannockella kyphosi TaxID=2899121 RepID=UPI0020114C04|nr:ATPase, T2SS/T4P/T4SS family [Tannockella kyphosi]
MNDQFEKIFVSAIKQNASDIHITLDKECMIYYRIHGVREFVIKQQYEQGLRLINQLKFLSNIDVNYKLKPQTGHFVFLYKQINYNLRISSIPSLTMESLVIRILDNHPDLEFHSLFIIKPIQEYLEWLVTRKQGLFVISGPTGSGKSTTLYTIIDELIKQDNFHIITLEDPIEVNKKKCLQIQINESMDITYHDTLKQVLRHDPDVIVIGEVRDTKTAKLAVSAALTGHLVLATIHASSCITTIQRLFNLECEALDIQETLIGVLNQSLLHQNLIKKTIVIGELINKAQLLDYFNKESSDYFTYQNCYDYLYGLKVIDKVQKEWLENG